MDRIAHAGGLFARMTRFGRILPMILVLAVVGCGASSASGSVVTGLHPKPSAQSHVVVIVMENKGDTDVIGRSSSPFVNALAKRWGLATQSYAVAHPSLPNYLALTSGSTHGIRSDCTSCTVSGPSVGDQLNSAAVSWKAYLQNYPHPGTCWKGDSGLYAQRHNPFVYYRHNAALCRHLVGFPTLTADINHGTLPTFVWITPNTCNDTHDCGVRTGDAFLHSLVPALVRELGPHGYLIVTWDEGSNNAHGGGHIATVVAGPDVRAGTRSAGFVNHYGVLGTIERSLRLPLLAGARSPASGSLSALFTRTPLVR